MKKVVLALLACALLASTSVLAATIYSETFSGGVGTFTISAGNSPSSGWAANSSCGASILASGHTAPEVLRWGTFANCSNYGDIGHLDTATTPAFPLPSGCTLSFNYFLEYEEPVSFENADVQVSAGNPLLSLANGSLNSSATWRAASASLPAGSSVAVEFVASTNDGLDNNGVGWLIDDVSIHCPGPTTVTIDCMPMPAATPPDCPFAGVPPTVFVNIGDFVAWCLDSDCGTAPCPSLHPLGFTVNVLPQPPGFPNGFTSTPLSASGNQCTSAGPFTAAGTYNYTITGSDFDGTIIVGGEPVPAHSRVGLAVLVVSMLLLIGIASLWGRTKCRT